MKKNQKVDLNMLSIKVVVFFLVLTTKAEISEDVLSNSIADPEGPWRANKTCNDSSRVEYWLFTRSSSNNYSIITSVNQIDSSKPIKILLHGWQTNGNAGCVRGLREAYLKSYDYNIISVDYDKYAAEGYATTFCHLPAIGSNIARFICKLNTVLNIKLENIHVIGHSLGGQVIGFAGRSAQKICGKIGRITGLDPAGPIYGFASTNFRVDKTDASLVDIIHTNQGKFGYVGRCGSVDFFPNGGYVQPGCEFQALSGSADLCSHRRSCDFFIESISRNGFYATSCNHPICIKEPSRASHAYMGEYLRTKPKDAVYTLRTNAHSPYGQGPIGSID